MAKLVSARLGIIYLNIPRYSQSVNDFLTGELFTNFVFASHAQNSHCKLCCIIDTTLFIGCVIYVRLSNCEMLFCSHMSLLQSRYHFGKCDQNKLL